VGKRSNFERRERDFYPTPAAAVAPLLKHLPEPITFCEPCAGDGALLEHLEDAGHHCLAAYDIEPQVSWANWGTGIERLDALELSKPLLHHADYIITNPPWERKLLHKLIETFAHLAPTWLLFDASWAFTKQSRPYLPYLRKIVAVGRVKWIEGSPHTGKDDCAWYHFDSCRWEPPEFYND
jgi:hypothetical protein